jgi:hypothetical protein
VNEIKSKARDSCKGNPGDSLRVTKFSNLKSSFSVKTIFVPSIKSKISTLFFGRKMISWLHSLSGKNARLLVGYNLIPKPLL